MTKQEMEFWRSLRRALDKKRVSLMQLVFQMNLMMWKLSGDERLLLDLMIEISYALTNTTFLTWLH